MQQYELQNFIFEQAQQRMKLLEYKSTLKKIFNVLIYRNHSFELIEHLISPYLDYAEIGVNFEYSDYDDSLSFVNLNSETDLIVLWLDLTRYETSNLKNFLEERINYLSKIYTKPILLAPFGKDIHINNLNIVLYSFKTIENKLGEKFTDLRLEEFTGTKLSSQACMQIAKDLGLNYFPALLKPNLKAIIVDLDNTLYKGILGEDGAENLELTSGHKKLQEYLKQKASEGFFLCAVSKNDKNDVMELFNKRPDFPLQKNDFTKIKASWDAKSKSISEIADYLNIGTDSIVFVDDNLGEIAEVKSVIPDIKTIWAKDDANITTKILSNYPRLLKLNSGTEDKLRSGDIIANEERRKLQNNLSQEDYLKSLDIEITYSINDKSQIKRISELSRKTNQFIFNYKRYSEAEIEKLMTEGYVISVSLKDKLSDSGIIGVGCGRVKNDYLELEECFVSCRALGRGLDEIIVSGMAEKLLTICGTKKLKVLFQKGERNIPAENYALKYFKQNLDNPEIFEFQIQIPYIKTMTIGGNNGTR